MIMLIVGIAGGILASAICVFGTFYGARHGSDKAIMTIMKYLEDYRNEEAAIKEKQRLERAKYIQAVIITFLVRELEENYSLLDLEGTMNLPIGTVFKLKFEEYEKCKYLLLENPTITVKEINNMYNLLYEISKMNNTSQVQGKIKKIDEIVEKRDTLDILLSDIKLMSFK
jgi:hypothetical protein